ncbi:protein delta homolog 2 [Electrophorus electricus]|uniref:protein delta homolog 2 n=1 Tax=Electrophorus electricus TaxID=8005 RepID=UPI0015D0A23A|nr:protein delta homolog 2 [Electrophorus electricus]
MCLCMALHHHLRTPALLSQQIQPRLPRTMTERLTLTLLLWSSCALIIPNCEGQVDTFPTPDVNCTCELGHGKCAEDGECRCDPGWEGTFCDDCVRMPGCVHGSCHQPWQCICEDGWAGRFCDKDVHVCEKEEPCQNGATCSLNEAGEYNCLCPEGFHGKHCELKTGPCHKIKSPCKNGGLCEDLGGFAPELSCRCLVGFTGPRCETNMDDCLMRPCANGATCLDGVNRFSCLCPAGFTGRFCTINLDDCASQPCLNGGRCIDRVTAFHCLCPPGYTGRTCEVPLWPKEAQTQAPRRGSFDWGGGGGWPVRFTQSKPNSSTSGNHFHGVTGSGGDSHLLKISVTEVVTQSGTGGLSEEQLITLLVLGGMTLAVVALTAGLVLRGHWQNLRVCSHCRISTSQQHPFQQCRSDQQHPVSTQQDCKISFLHTSVPAELEKKRLNTEVI